MLKRLILMAMIAVMICSAAVPAFAESSDIYNPYSGTTSQFLVTIFRPDGDESTFKSSYVISGSSNEEGIVVKLLIDDGYGNFTPFCDTNNESEWGIGAAGFFMREVVLPNVGANKIRIVAYRESEADSLVMENNLQINDFTIMVFNPSIKDSIRNGRFNLTNIFNSIPGLF